MTAHAGSSKVADVLYAAPSRLLQAGEVVKFDDVELIHWPGTHAIEGAFSKVTDVVGREALFPMAKDQPILDRDLSAPGAGTGLASKIPDGKRAVALRSDEVVGVAGFLVPGSHLDVLVTYHSNTTPEPLTATLLQNVVVIAAGHEIEPNPTGKPSDVTIVTLLLTPEESQRAVLAGSQGAIHFVLRNGADSSVTGQTPTLLSQLAGHPLVPGRTVAAAPLRPERALPAPRHEIETILGGASNDVRSVEPGGSGR
jgi:pilus assembly protein CpaB